MLSRPHNIDTERLSLHSLSKNDEVELINIFTNPIVKLTYMVPELTTSEQKHGLFNRLMTLSQSQEKFVYGIYANDKLIGLINEVENDGKTIELGYVISPNEHNKGYATEALSACIVALFLMGYSTVRTGAFENNIPSMRVMEKSGMHKIDYTEKIEYKNTIHNCIFYEIKNPNV